MITQVLEIVNSLFAQNVIFLVMANHLDFKEFYFLGPRWLKIRRGTQSRKLVDFHIVPSIAKRQHMNFAR